MARVPRAMTRLTHPTPDTSWSCDSLDDLATGLYHLGAAVADKGLRIARSPCHAGARFYGDAT